MSAQIRGIAAVSEAVFHGVQAEKALLLASLLLGYGLDAWVVFGTDAVGQHVWVLTRSSRDSVVFWDACTGKYCF